MTSIHKFIGFLIAAAALAVFAAPASAQQKVYSLNMAPASITSGTSASMTATFKNETPNGNSTINSVSLTAPTGLTITAASIASGNVAIVPGGKTVNITNMYPVKPGDSVVLSLTVTSAASCTPSSGNWSAVVYTGSSLSGQTFGLVANHSSLGTSIGSSGCSYTFTTTPAAVNAGASSGLTATVTNTSASGTMTSFVLTAPAGLNITGATGGSGTVAFTATSVTVTGVSVGSGGAYPVSVTVSPAASCTGTAAASWSSSVNSGGFAISGANPTTAITAQACSMTITGPSSGAAGVSFSVTVNLISGPGGANVTLTSDCSFTGAGTKAATGSSAVFTGTVVNPTTCSFGASADNGYGSASPLSGFKVYAGVLDCNTAAAPVFPPVPGPGYFAVLPMGVSGAADPGFAAGYRLKDDKHPEMCVLADYTLTNNILGTGATFDGAGNTIPPNSAALVWDLPLTPNAVFVYELTFNPEYVDVTTGLPIKKTKFCILGTGPTDCTVLANQKNLQACMDTAFSSTSIPGSDPACIMQETWTTLPASACAGLTNPNANNPVPFNAPPACVKGTDEILDARDPPIIRG